MSNWFNESKDQSGFSSPSSPTLSSFYCSEDHIEINETPSDSISCISWSSPFSSAETQIKNHSSFASSAISENTFISCSSWDGSLSIWQAKNLSRENKNANFIPLVLKITSSNYPLLCCIFNQPETPEELILFSGGCDGVGKALILKTQQSIEIARHNGPISRLSWLDEYRLLVTGGWDGNICFWDLRNKNLINEIKLTENDKVYDMEVLNKTKILSVVSGRKVRIWDLKNMQHNKTPDITLPCNSNNGNNFLDFKLRCGSVRADGKGCIFGSIEGRCQVVFFSSFSVKDSYRFKCHRCQHSRDISAVYAVNIVKCHPTLPNICATGGADGSIVIWDIANKSRVKGYDSCKIPIIDFKWHSSGEAYAYAASYDWSMGNDLESLKKPNKIFIAEATDVELKRTKDGTTIRK